MALSRIPDLQEAIAIAELEAGDGIDLPLFRADSVAAAVVDRAGKLVHASSAFAELKAEEHVDPELAARAARGATVTVTVELVTADGRPDTLIFAYAPGSQTGGWRLTPDVREAVERGAGHVVVLTSRAASSGLPLEDACRAYGLNGLQTRVVMAVIRTGSVKAAAAAAAAAAVSYNTAREATAEAMRRAHAPRLPALVSALGSLAFGVLPRADSAAVLQDLWGLSPRQAAIAALIAAGASRTAAANVLETGEAVVRKELERIHEALRVATGAELARRVVEANALRWLTEATGGDLGFIDSGLEPLQFVHRPDGRRIAISDYGPASGRPILVVHSSTSTRIVGRKLLRTLQAAGYRPISIDRPGFGLTDEVAEAIAGDHDPFATAARDAVLVLDRLKVRDLDVVARGAAQYVIALERAAPDRLRRVVLVNPDPPMRASGALASPTGLLKEAFVRNPALVRRIAPLFAREATVEAVAKRMMHGARGSAPDEAALQDRDLIHDYFRAVRPFATGRTAGWINEQTEFIRGAHPEPLAGATDWRVLVGASDTMHDPRAVVAYWSRALPDAQIRLVPDTGRYLALSHPHLVAQALAD